MNKDLLKFRSIKNLKSTVEETHTLINALNSQIIATRQLINFTKMQSNPGYNKFKKYLEIDNEQIQKLFELGFIKLFADFECFMYEFLKDLFKKYPSSLQEDEPLTYKDIKHLKKIKDVKEYVIDSQAIKKSYDIETWSCLIFQKYGITVFGDNDELRRFKALSSLRNIFLHSGAKTNSKFQKEMKNFLNTPVPIGMNFSLNRIEYFEILYRTLKHLVLNIENQKKHL